VRIRLLFYTRRVARKKLQLFSVTEYATYLPTLARTLEAGQTQRGLWTLVYREPESNWKSSSVHWILYLTWHQHNILPSCNVIHRVDYRKSSTRVWRSISSNVFGEIVRYGIMEYQNPSANI